MGRFWWMPGALRSALRSTESSVLVASGDIRTGMAGSPDEKDGGDAGSAILVGESTDSAPVIAEAIAVGSATREFLDRWRAPGDLRTHSWEDRFGEQRYAALATTAFDAALKDYEDVIRKGLDAARQKAGVSPSPTGQQQQRPDPLGLIGGS